MLAIEAVNGDERAVAAFDAIATTNASEYLDESRTFLVFSIEETDEFVEIYASAKRARNVPSQIVTRPRAQPALSWGTQIIAETKRHTLFKISIPRADLREGDRFFVQESKKWIRILQPYHPDIALPEGWSFSPDHLYLIHSVGEAGNPTRQRAFVREVAQEDGEIVINGALITSYPVDTATMALRKFREEQICTFHDLNFVPAKRIWGIIADAYRAYRGEWAYKFQIRIKLDWSQMPSSLYSLIIHINNHMTGLFPYNANFMKKANTFGIDGSTLYAHIDPISRNLRLEKFGFSFEHWPTLYEASRHTKESQICLLGEYTNAARDNSLHLFNHLRTSSKTKAYYVIEEGCGLEGPGVVNYGSIEHLKLCLETSVVAFTHHPTYVFPSFAMRLREKKLPRMMFLQHGVTALKNSMPAYHSSKRKFDAFAVCSRREAADVAKACAYDKRTVQVCGFPRLDNLYRLSRSIAPGNKIVVFPTWRRGLDKRTSEEFIQSQFFNSWVDALRELREFARQNDAIVQLVSHPIIARHASAFEPYVDEMVDVEDIQNVIAGSACLITDYSSIAFDFLYGNKNVVFYTFDEDEVRFQETAFIDTDNELPGYRARKPDEVVQAMASLWPTRHDLDDRTRGLLDLYFENIDDQNCVRVEKLIKKLAKQAN